MKKYIIGITGGIGSGKSTVAEILRSMNYPVIDADILAKDVLNDEKILSSLKQEFPQAFTENTLNKKVLSDIVFNSKQKLLKLEEELYKKIEEYTTNNDSLEEIFENKEQIEVAKYYERLPKSTLIMLVSAFSTKENILNAYKCAVEEKYRFFSFGDAMMIGDFKDE